MYYVKRQNTGILVKDEYKEKILNIGVKGYLNSLCMENLSTFDGRKKAIGKLLGQKSNIPIYINNNIFVYPTKSLREYDMYYINYYEVLSVKKIDDSNTLFVFKNLEEVSINVNIRKTLKQHTRIKKIIEYFDNIS